MVWWPTLGCAIMVARNGLCDYDTTMVTYDGLGDCIVACDELYGYACPRRAVRLWLPMMGQVTRSGCNRPGD